MVSSAFSPPVVSQPLAPIGTPALKSDSQSERSHTARLVFIINLPASSLRPG